MFDNLQLSLPAVSKRPKNLTTVIPWDGVSNEPRSPYTPNLSIRSKSSSQPSSGNWVITESEIFNQFNIHKRFHLPDIAPGLEEKNLPMFDDFSQYGGTSQEIQELLVAKQVSRLASIMLYPKPLEFKGSDKLAVDSVSSYETFVKLSTALLQSLDVVEYDGECLTAEQGHLKRLASIVLIRRVRVSLDFTCNQDEDSPDREMTEVSSEHRLDLFALVDYCTEVMARVICGNAHSKSTAIEMLAHLAKISAKTKVVSANTRDFAQISIQEGLSEAEWDRVEQRLKRQGNNSNSWDHQPKRNMAMYGTHLCGLNLFLDADAFEDQPTAPRSKRALLREESFGRCSQFRRGILDLWNLLLHK